MNLLAGLLILICLIGSEMIGFKVAEDLWLRLSAVFVTAIIVPSLAFFQTVALLPKMRSESISLDSKRSLCRRMTASHAVVWLSASLAMIWALRWQDVVRGNWQLNQWPLIDELLILAPVLFSMVASWAVFYDLQAAISESDRPRKSRTLKQALRPRLEFISIRFRLYFLLVLLPISLFVLARDVAALSSNVPNSISFLLIGIEFIAMFITFPLLVLLIWKTSPIMPVELRTRLLKVCQQDRLGVWNIRRWNTGNQMVNAVVVGMVPRFRFILLSDGLLNYFKTNEIMAVLRHEAGHIRLWHLPTRLLFLTLPLIALAVCDSNGFSLHPTASTDLLEWLRPKSLLLLVGLAIYVVTTTRWLSHQMEYEADIYSIQSDSAQSRRRGAFTEKPAQTGSAGMPPTGPRHAGRVMEAGSDFSGGNRSPHILPSQHSRPN